MYKALPSFLEIKDSPINGQGIFAKEDIAADVNLGLSHVMYQDQWVRTPLGGFYNHSDEPNCIKRGGKSADFYELWTTKDIAAGEELTCFYTLYELEFEDEQDV